MPRIRDQKQRRQEILSAARRVIATQGLSSLTRKSVAEEAGLTAPSISYYYPDLEELLIDVYERQINKYLEQCPIVIAKHDSPWEQLSALIELALAKGPQDIDSVITYQFSGEPRFVDKYRIVSSNLHQHEISRYAKIIKAGIDSGMFSTTLNPLTIAKTIVALVDAYGLQVIVEEPDVDYPSALNEIKIVIASILNYQ